MRGVTVIWRQFDAPDIGRIVPRPGVTFPLPSM